jgi:integrase
LRQERDRAAVVFLFLSAMRAQAFASLPLKCVNLDKLIVQQLPEMGVKTKNRKAAKTALLRINDLLEVVRAWDAKMRAAGQTEEDLWFPVLTHLGEFSHEPVSNFANRRQDISKGVMALCKQTGVPYMSLHKFRHGHIYFMMKRVKDMRQLKALSQNVMHSSVAITDGIYGRLVSDDIQDTYEEFGE